jgi:hypothetical protein
MNDILNQWFAERASAPGILVCGVRLADGMCVCHAANENCPPEKMEKILQQLADVQALFFDNHLQTRCSTWIFEQGKIRSVARADGLLLGLIVRADANAEQSLGQLSEEFLKLELAAQ